MLHVLVAARAAHRRSRASRSLPPGHLHDRRGRRRRRPRATGTGAFPDGPGRPSTTADGRDAPRSCARCSSTPSRLRLRADVPVGAYLSGGLDSSIITALIKQLHRRRRCAPSRSTFEDAEFDESALPAGRWSAHLGTEPHVDRAARAADIGAAFPRAIWHTETPILRTAPTPLHAAVAALVRERGYKVVLTGEGADEVFGGYDLFKEAKIRRFWARRPESRAAAAAARAPLPVPGAARRPRRRAYARELLRAGPGPIAEPAASRTCRAGRPPRRTWRFFIAGRCAARSATGTRSASCARTLPAGHARAGTPLCRDQYVEAHTLLSGYLLSSQGDRMAMANSVEGRFPFLDHRVIEFANRLPALLQDARASRRSTSCKRAAGRPAAARDRPADQAALPRARQPPASSTTASRWTTSAELLSPGAARATRVLRPGGRSRKLLEKCRARPGASASPTTWPSSASCRRCCSTTCSSAAPAASHQGADI